MAETPKVALLIETARGYGRGLLRGIVRYARLHGPWAFYVTPGDFEQALPAMEQWGGTGIIARIENRRIARAILDSGLPVIALDLSDEQLQPDSPLCGVCEVRSDSYHAAQMAADHLLERGFQHFAFVGIPGRVWSRRRSESFSERITAAGFQPHVYRPPSWKRDREWGSEQTFMAEWLRELPKPVGLMACNDDRGRQVLEACRAAGHHVPEEVAVVGVDNDSLLCDLSDPPLSSVALNAERGGYEAAALLDRLMRGQARRPRRIAVEPLHVVTRRSTDVVALDDRKLAEPAGVGHHWQALGRGRLFADDDRPLNGETCQAIESDGPEAGVQQSPLCIRRGEAYHGSLWAKGEAPAGLFVRLVNGNETWHLGPEKYVEYVRRFAPAMKKADPSIKLAACGSAGYGAKGNGLPWNQAIVDGCAELIDYLSIHHYENPNRFAEGPRAYEAFFRETGKIIAASRNPKLKIYCSEWNAQSTDWRTGLYAGGLLNAFERSSDWSWKAMRGRSTPWQRSRKTERRCTSRWSTPRQTPCRSSFLSPKASRRAVSN